MAFGMRPEHIPVEKHEIVWYENVGSSGKGSEWKRHVVAPFACAFETIPRGSRPGRDVVVQRGQGRVV
jgi:hypothetical protein